MSKSAIEITHHSGLKRYLNTGEGPWESVDINEQGQAIIRMTSGTTHQTSELAVDILAALGVKVSRVRATLAESLAIEDKSTPEPEQANGDEVDPDIIPPQVKGNS